MAKLLGNFQTIDLIKFPETKENLTNCLHLSPYFIYWNLITSVKRISRFEFANESNFFSQRSFVESSRSLSSQGPVVQWVILAKRINPSRIAKDSPGLQSKFYSRVG